MKANSTQILAEFQNTVGSHGERWRHCEGQPESTLVRLAILRDIVRELHAQKSKFLAAGQRDLAQTLRSWESRLHDLRNHSRLEGDLVELVTGTSEIRKRTRLLPEALYTSIEKEKLERYDRQWEAALAGEAVGLGWRFWALEAWVEITLVEEWNLRMTEQLWPTGIVLFTESSSTQGPRGRSINRDGAAGGPAHEFPLWRGRWIMIIHPRFKNGAEIALNFAQWPGTPSEAPSPPHWKLLFSPKIR